MLLTGKPSAIKSKNLGFIEFLHSWRVLILLAVKDTRETCTRYAVYRFHWEKRACFLCTGDILVLQVDIYLTFLIDSQSGYCHQRPFPLNNQPIPWNGAFVQISAHVLGHGRWFSQVEHFLSIASHPHLVQQRFSKFIFFLTFTPIYLWFMMIDSDISTLNLSHKFTIHGDVWIR